MTPLTLVVHLGVKTHLGFCIIEKFCPELGGAILRLFLNIMGYKTDRRSVHRKFLGTSSNIREFFETGAILRSRRLIQPNASAVSIIVILAEKHSFRPRQTQRKCP